MTKVAAIILAGGEGKRMKTKNVNKVVLPLANKQMILHSVGMLESLKIKPVIVVVGFAKKSVIDVLGKKVTYIEQKKRLGTAHAVNCALKKIGQDISDVLVLNGDDSAFYKQETILALIKKHNESVATITFLTIELDNPTGLGRVIRGNSERVLAVVEDRDASEEQRKIKEINPACYIFELGFLHRNLRKIKKSEVSGEYYLTSLIDIAIKNNEKVEVLEGGKLPWRGINTIEELKEAERLFVQTK